MCDFAPLNPSPDYIARFYAAMSGLVAPSITVISDTVCLVSDPVRSVVASKSGSASDTAVCPEVDRAPGAEGAALHAPGVARQGEGA